ncbi:MAG: CSLREA domain-containing protein, partial [Actinomycetota bacterium]|nr:CSLREA domain-containing protein [Actinomycetota bacterium]
MIEARVERAAKRRVVAMGFLLVALTVLFLVLTAGKPAQGRPPIGDSFTVNSTGDQADANLENSLCDVDLAVTGNQCTLRAAIEEANDTPNGTLNGIPVNNVIRFNIAGGGVQTIQPLSELPAITDAVTIDGYTQPGASPNTLAQGNDAVLNIVLNGTGAGVRKNGLTIQAPNSIVRGLVINSFGGDGILITGSGATNNAVRGNFIGTDATGMQDQGNIISGVEVRDASNNTIGGTSPADRNVISGHKVFEGVSLGFGATGNAVQGNYVGTNAAGTAAIPNSRGIALIGSNNTIGGTTAGARNVVSGNDHTGIEVSGGENLIQGNFIGTDVTGQGDLGNGGIGVTVFDLGIAIGGTQAGAGNLIAFNGDNMGDSGHGVVVSSFDENNASILSNSIHSNAGLGIELGRDGITVNDPDDPDTGPNDLQNFPIIASTTTTGGSTTVEATLDSTPSTAFTVQFYSRPAGTDEGNTFLGEKAVTTDANGDAAFSFTTAQAVPAGQEVTATATSPTGDTSEFYQFLENETFVVNSTADPGDGVCDENECTLRDAIRAANRNPLKSTIEFDIPGSGVHTIAPTSVLQINRQVVIDGYTQPGASPNTQAGGSNAVLKIELSGENLGPGSAGLYLNHPNSVVRGLVIIRFSNAGLYIDGDVKVEGNFIG